MFYVLASNQQLYGKPYPEKTASKLHENQYAIQSSKGRLYVASE